MLNREIIAVFSHICAVRLSYCPVISMEGGMENRENVRQVNRITGKVSGWASLRRCGCPTYNS
jgi:hypothetical protein